VKITKIRKHAKKRERKRGKRNSIEREKRDIESFCSL